MLTMQSFRSFVVFGFVGAALWAQAGPDVMLRALELYRHGNCKEAEPLFEQMLARQPKNTSIRKLYAGCLMQSGRQEQGRAQYRMVLAIAPTDADALQAMRPVSPGPTRLPQPAPVTAGAVTPIAPAPAPELREADSLIQAHKLPEAEKVLEKLVARANPSVVARQRLAEIYTATKRYDKAAALYEQLAAAGTARSPFLLRAAQNYAWNKDFDRSVELYGEQLKKTPADFDARLGLANVLMWAGKLEKAGDEYRAYLDLKPADAEARLSYASTLVWTRRYADALEQLAAVKSVRPLDPRPDAMSARCYEAMGLVELAAEAYDRALKMNPDDGETRDARAKLLAEIPKKKAFARMESNDNEGAAKYFIAYLREHPESTETMLEAARAYSWSKKYAEATDYYRQYLARKPQDWTAMRELAQVHLAQPDFAAARQDFEALVKSASAGIEDYEGLIHAFAWDGKLSEAQPSAEHLAQLDRNNSVARQAIADYVNQQKEAIAADARKLVAARDYAQAIVAYKGILQRFGADQQTEVMIARLYSWNEQYDKAEVAYHNYLLKYPDDRQSRLEMANVEQWDGKYNSATATYRAIVREDPRNANALLGLAQISDYRGGDAFSLLRGYRQVLQADPKNQAAHARVEELIPLTSPAVGYSARTFGDSDGFYRALNTFEGGVPFAGNLKLTPYYTVGYFHQYRQVGGSGCGDQTVSFDFATQALNQKICDQHGTFWGNGGGAKLQLGSASRTNLNLDFGMMRFTGDKASLTGSADLTFDLGASRKLSFNVYRRSAVFDVNTIGALAADILGETALASYQSPLTDRWKVWVAGGVTRYSRGTSDVFSGNQQRRISARLDYQVTPELTAGYMVRDSSFDHESTLYFSPQRYTTYGFAYSWNHPLSHRVRFAADGEVGLGQVKRFDTNGIATLEVAIQPMIVWQIYPGFDFHLGYRFSRGRSSTFGSPVYSTGGLDLGLSKSLAERLSPFDPARLDLGR